MKLRADNERLLDDVLGDGLELRAALLEATLRRVRRRNHVRQLQRGGVVMLAVFAAVSLALWKIPPSAQKKVQSKKPELVVIRSRPLDPVFVIRSRLDTVAIVNSLESGLAVVETG